MSSVNFILVCPARSGSTLMRQFLDRHPQICCHGEVFGKNKVHGYSSNAQHALSADDLLKLRRRYPMTFMNEFVFASPRPISGFKLLYSQLFTLQFTPLLQAILAETTKLRIVHVWRRNLVARHLSEVYHRFDLLKIKQGADMPQSWIQEQLQPEAVSISCQENIAARECSKLLFRHLPSIEIAYEDFVKDVETRRKLCAFLGADPDRMRALPPKEQSGSERSEMSLAGSEGLERFHDYR